MFMKACEINGKDKPNCNQIENLERILSEIPVEDIIQKNADIFKALGDPLRLKIIYLLEHGELCVCEIMTALDKPQPTISHHLNLLKNVGLLKWRKDGVWIYYKLSNPKLPESLKELLKKSGE
jgi:DNA-binding transcriptional ArsR family regulator